MKTQKNEFYLSTPDGDIILAEVFSDGNTFTLLMADKQRFDLSMNSAYELADNILLAISRDEVPNVE